MDFTDIIPESDRAAYSKGRMIQRMGFGKRPAVAVIDMTYGFVDPSFPLASGDMCLKAVKAIRILLDAARLRNIPILYSKSATAGSTLPGEYGVSRKSMGGTLSNPKANEIVEEIAPQKGDFIIEKNRASIFFGTPTLSYLIHRGVDTLIVSGATTSGCVRASVVDAASNTYYVIIPEECVADRAVVPHKVNLFDMDMKYGDVVPLSDVLDYLKSLES